MPPNGCDVCGIEIPRRALRCKAHAKEQQLLTARRASAARRAADPTIDNQKRRSQFFRKLGITAQLAEAAFVEQGSRCSICSRPLVYEVGTRETVRSRSFMDHDHETGCFRAWLCGNCNSGLGFFSDDSSRLRAAADYLDYHSSKQSS